MTKKHLIALADMMKLTRPTVGFSGKHFAGQQLQWETDLHALADLCAEHNAGFKRDLWLAYVAGEVRSNGGRARA